MEVRMERRGGALLAAPEGRIDSATARDFESKMKAAIQDDDSAVVVNLSQLSYISSAGLRAVLVIAKGLWRRDASFALCELPDTVREIVQLSGFDKIIQIHGSEAEAIEAVGT